MNYAEMTTPAEMEEARAWTAGMVARLAQRSSYKDAPEVLCLRQSWGGTNPVTGWSIVGGPLCLAGKTYRAGLGTHAVSRIAVRLPEPGARLTGLAGVNDSDDTRRQAGALTFSINVGERTVWSSAPQKADAPPARVEADLNGATEFVLCVDGPIVYAHADWVDLSVTTIAGRTIPIGAPESASPCLNFRYGGHSAHDLLHRWDVREEIEPSTDDVQRRRIIRRDPITGLELSVEITAYREFPVVEWVARLKNTGSSDTPIIENLRSFDTLLPAAPDAILHHWNGDYCAADGYEPRDTRLRPGTPLRFAPVGSRPTNKAWPYFNLESASVQRGVIAVVGWSGQWAAEFLRDEGSSGVRLEAGQETTRFVLHPGEEVRTPVSVLMFYHGDFVRSQNLWRRWMMACAMPRLHGGPPQPFYAANWGVEMHPADEASQITYFDRCVEEKVKPDVWWMDAGWYPFGGTWMPTGTWEVDKVRFPRGLKGIADHTHRQGTETLVWFEPERVYPNTWLAKEHPEWLLESGALKPGEANFNWSRLLDLGNPQAWRWLVENTCRLLVEEGIDIYRQDFNFDPLPYWRVHDAPDRQGITEIRHVEGYLAFWKELRRRFPDMLIDSCSAGGRRNDLETMRMSVPLHKTDYNYSDLPAKQAMHYSLYHWIPFIGAGVCPDESANAFRTAMCPCMVTGFNMVDGKIDFAQVRRMVQEWRRIAPLFSGDYYPLTPYDRRTTQWIAWQFHRSDLGEGMIQAFRRADSPFVSAQFRLRGLDDNTVYTIADTDAPASADTMTGAELMEKGLLVTMQNAPQAVTVVYKARA